MIATCTLLAIPTHAEAQTNPGSTTGVIVGRVVDSTSNRPLSLANVELKIPGAAAIVARGATGADGSFRIEALAPGRYTVRIRALGYTPRPLPTIEIASSASSIDLGTVFLFAAPVQLQALSVTGQKQDVQLAPDRNTFVVRDMPTTRGGTALDVLRNVPSVDVDIDNVVSLRGNSGVTVQINGRPSPMKPAQLGNFLAQLPAEIVDKVEIVTSPSARDDPEGIAGIINIVLKEKPETARSGGLTVGVGTTGHVDVGGNVGFEQGPLSFYGSYGFWRDSRPRTDSTFRQNLFLDPQTFLDESGLRSQIPLVHTFTGNLGYSPGQHDELSRETVYSTRIELEKYNILYRDLNAAQQLTRLSDRITSDTNHEMSFESALSYKHTFSDKAHKLSGELSAVRDGEDAPTSIASRTLALDGTPTDTTALERQTAWDHPTEYSVKADYVRPLTSGTHLEAGYKGSLQRFHSTLDTQVFDNAPGAYVPDPARINDFTYRQVVNAAYGMLGGESGKFQYQGGARVEHAATQFHLTQSGAQYDNPYNSIFPSGLIAYHIDDEHELKLSYSTRIRRPDDTDQLDPTPRILDPLNISRGNPHLKPEYIRALELGIQRSTDHATVQVTPFYRHTLDAIRTLRTLDTSGVSTRTFANVSTTNAYGTDVTVSLSGGRLSGFVSGSGFKQISDAANLLPGLSANTFGWTARTNAVFRVSSTVDIQTLLSYQAPMNVVQGRNASRTRVSFAMRQKLMNDQMSVTLRVIDPFNTSLERSTTIDPAFYQVSARRRLQRGLLFSVNWLFGQKKKGDDRIDLSDTGA
ncbi:MAG: TonB-dependent receptor domain-containing protein [Gemmatimonadaceae bacterium]